MAEAKQFFQKFQNLWQAGTDARLSLECHAGQVWLNLQVHLLHQPSPSEQHRQPTRRQGPSRLRRLARRAEARAAKASATEAAVKVVPTESVVNASNPTKEGAAQASPSPPFQEQAAVQAAPLQQQPPLQQRAAV